MGDSPCPYLKPHRISLPSYQNIQFKAINTDITSLTIHEATVKIMSSACSGCKKIPDITIPDSVTYVGSSAFFNCTSATNITIGTGVTFIGNSDEKFFICGLLLCRKPLLSRLLLAENRNTIIILFGNMKNNFNRTAGAVRFFIARKAI